MSIPATGMALISSKSRPSVYSLLSTFEYNLRVVFTPPLTLAELFAFLAVPINATTLLARFNWRINHSFSEPEFMEALLTGYVFTFCLFVPNALYEPCDS